MREKRKEVKKVRRGIEVGVMEGGEARGEGGGFWEKKLVEKREELREVRKGETNWEEGLVEKIKELREGRIWNDGWE